MSDWSERLTRLHQPLDKGALRVLAMVLGFYHVAMVMWDPEAYAVSIGGFNAIIGPLLIWAMCSSMVYGVGFKPRYWLWQGVFSPYFSLPILVGFLFLRFSGAS
ncbi:MAG: cyd operon protein YbgE [Vibrio metschnikovii]|uniref:cyd operon protein YbgE n=1 Tax=Vibrio metschnikovii TaxID=28172 RepID=UPI001C2F2BAF|nr:cyd operon protein YbgE [Vibrio metschnikovii]MDM7485598.1 cyd operon protein YbgE [Vibrio metschnikovii]